MKNRNKKDSPLSVFLVLLILCGILNKIISVIAPALEIFFTLFLIGIVAYVAYLIYSFLTRKKEAQGNQIHSENSSTYFGAKNDSIKRQLEILMESTALVNDSNNLDTVLHRYDLVCSCLEKLAPYSDSELKAAGYKLTDSLSDTKDFIQKNKISIVNQAIERNIRYELDQLKTNNGKIRKLSTLYDNMKIQDKLEIENILFLNSLHRDLMDSLNNNSSVAEKNAPVSSYPCVTDFASSHNLNISTEIIDLIWIGDGPHKNYIPDPPKTIFSDNKVTVSFSTNMEDEPSALYLSLPIAEPEKNSLVERPPYYPSYKGLTPEQRWLYWNFLSSPFSSGHNVGYAFLFYYGLERHLLAGCFDKAFDTILKLRNVYDNPSFQYYTGNALTLICSVKQRADLALKFLEYDSKSKFSSIPVTQLLLLKYTFHLSLTASEIIKNYQYFGFMNNNYIKGQPQLFSETLLELINRDFHSSDIDLNLHFPMDIQSLDQKHEQIFANTSLRNYETPVPIFKNEMLSVKICSLLEETHEKVKSKLKEFRKQGIITPEKKPERIAKLSPIESENIPKHLKFDFTEMKGCEAWPTDKIIHVFFGLSEIIQKNKEILPRIEACEKSYRILKPVIDILSKDPSGLPPVISCRDYGPSAYMKLGDWEQAERIITFCISTGAYKYPDDTDSSAGKSELEYLTIYKKIGDYAIAFIKENPGFLQKNIYSALLPKIGEENIHILKAFMRDTYVFHKQPYKSTNQLYYIERK